MLRLEGAGVTLAAESHGDVDNDLVIFLHGGGQSRSAWRGAARAIAAAGYHALAVDLRGHGESEWAPDGNYHVSQHVADVVRVIEAFGGAAVLVGASLGGHIALLVAAERPDLVRAAALADVTPWVDESLADVLRTKMRASETGFDDLTQAAASLDSLSPGRGARSAERLRGHLRQDVDGRYYWRWDPRVIDDAFVRHAGEGGLFEQAARRIAVPLLAMRAEFSTLVFPDQLDRLRLFVPHVETREIAGIEHMLTGDSNEAYAMAILDFLPQLQVPREKTGPYCRAHL